MVIEKKQPWYVAKRARAYIYSLFAERNLTVRDETHQDFGVDFVIDLRKGKRELGRSLAVQLLAYPEFPSVADLNGKVARQLPAKIREEMLLPLVAFVVQVRALSGRYCWLNEPVVTEGSASLRAPLEYEWKKLDDRAVDEMLQCVSHFWDTLLKRVQQA